MSKPVGRPMKYDRFILILEDDTIYTPATIVRYGEERGLFSSRLKGPELAEAKLRVRHTLARFSTNHKFPGEGDGWTIIEGQAPLRGWFGKRWKKALRDKY